MPVQPVFERPLCERVDLLPTFVPTFVRPYTGAPRRGSHRVSRGAIIHIRTVPLGGHFCVSPPRPRGPTMRIVSPTSHKQSSTISPQTLPRRCRGVAPCFTKGHVEGGGTRLRFVHLAHPIGTCIACRQVGLGSTSWWAGWTGSRIGVGPWSSCIPSQ